MRETFLGIRIHDLRDGYITIYTHGASAAPVFGYREFRKNGRRPMAEQRDRLAWAGGPTRANLATCVLRHVTASTMSVCMAQGVRPAPHCALAGRVDRSGPLRR